MPETMTFDEKPQGWKMMAKWITRYPPSERVANHIEKINKEKSVFGNM